jgi:hypothetical protein
MTSDSWLKLFSLNTAFWDLKKEEVTPNPSVDICVAVATEKVRKRSASFGASTRRISPCLAGATPLLGNTDAKSAVPFLKPGMLALCPGHGAATGGIQALDDVRWVFQRGPQSLTGIHVWALLVLHKEPQLARCFQPARYGLGDVETSLQVRPRKIREEGRHGA